MHWSLEFGLLLGRLCIMHAMNGVDSSLGVCRNTSPKGDLQRWYAPFCTWISPSNSVLVWTGIITSVDSIARFPWQAVHCDASNKQRSMYTYEVGPNLSRAMCMYVLSISNRGLMIPPKFFCIMMHNPLLLTLDASMKMQGINSIYSVGDFAFLTWLIRQKVPLGCYHTVLSDH